MCPMPTRSRSRRPTCAACSTHERPGARERTAPGRVPQPADSEPSSRRRERRSMSYDLLDGVKVVELSLYAFAPSAAAVLADWGADVVKIVPPTVADPMMGSPIARLPERDVGVEFMWEIMNRGKRCIGLDVSLPHGQQVLHELVADADVFVTNLLPGARRRFRADTDDLFAVNEGLIYARATG